MTKIIRANTGDVQLLARVGSLSFIESHGHSAPAETVNKYVADHYNEDAFKAELGDAANIYHLIFYNDDPAGYSKIILNAAHPNVPSVNATKLERLYLLKAFYGLKLGFELLELNVELSKENQQDGMWLFVWKKNQRAIDFYLKNNFEIIGSHDFKLSETHANPNHQMFLRF